MNDMDFTAWDRPVFAIGQTTVTIGDTICAGHFRGELAAAWKRVVGIMQGGESASAPDDVELQASSEEFRIDRDLITAEETEGWLEERGLTLERIVESGSQRQSFRGAPGNELALMNPLLVLLSSELLVSFHGNDGADVAKSDDEKQSAETCNQCQVFTDSAKHRAEKIGAIVSRERL